MKKYVITKVIAPIFVGAFFYFLFCPDTAFVQLIDRLTGFSHHFTISMNCLPLRIVRFYLLDFLWSYALMSVVLILFGFNYKVIFSVYIFMAVLESMQLLDCINGTFDVCDVVVEILAGIIVIKMSRRRIENEKD